MIKTLFRFLSSLWQSFIFRLAAAFFLMIVLMAIGIGTGIYAVNQLIGDAQRLARVKGAESLADDFTIIILDDSSKISQFVSLNQYQSLSEYKNKYAINDRDFRNYAEEYLILVEDVPQEKQFVAAISEAKIQLSQLLDQMLEQLGKNNPEQAIKILQGDFNQTVFKASDLLSQQLAKLDATLEQRSKEASTNATFNQALLLVVGVFAALVGLILAIFLALKLGGKVKNLERAVVNLGRGNLTTRIQLPGQDELGRVGQAFNQMADRLQKLIESIEYKRSLGREAGSEVNVIVTQLNSAVVEQSHGATEQAAAVSQVTSTLEELGAASSHIAEHATEVAGSANKTLNTAKYVKSIAEEVYGLTQTSQTGFEQNRLMVNQVEAQIVTARKLLEDLVTHSNQIDSIVEFMSGIATETHLLALNGAIEAASAGAYGERFAVVANEVRALSDRSRGAAREVAQVTGKVRSSINQLTSAVEETALSSQTSVQLSETASQAIGRLSWFAQEINERFGQIVMAMSEVTNLSEQIKVTTIQQDSSNEQLIESMRTLNSTSQIMASGSQQLAETTYQLQLVSENMNEKMAA